MRVGLVHLDLADYTAALANALNTHVDLVVITPVDLRETMARRLDRDVQRVEFEPQRFRDPRSVRSAWKLARLIDSLGLDLCHFQQLGNAWYESILPLRSRTPRVVTVHDVDPHPGDGDRLPGSTWSAKRMRTDASVIVHTKLAGEKMIDEGLASAVGVIPHGELGSLYRRFEEDAVDGQQTNLVLFFGRRFRYKGLDVLIDAMELVRSSCPDAELVIAGRGDPVEGPLPEWMQVRDRYVGEAETVSLFRQATVVALPYREASQSGVASLAVGLRRPLVASAVGGLRELLGDTGAGLTVGPGDSVALAEAIVRVLGDDQLRREMGDAQRLLCENELNWDTIAAQSVECYKTSLA